MTDWDTYEPQELERDNSGARTSNQTGRGQDGFSAKETDVVGFGGQHGPKASELGGEYDEGHDDMSCCSMSEENGGMGHAQNEYSRRHNDDDD